MRDRLLAALPDATALAQAPGRVNLIGEHTDYNGFGVLPLAIDRRVWVAAAPRPAAEIVVRNVAHWRYPTERIPCVELLTRARRGTWVDYVVAAARCRPPAGGIELVVGGDLPSAAGLSSSSALVVATLLALGPAGERRELAVLASAAERYVGTLSGGMDQTIALLAEPGQALAIDFNPLRAAAVPLPADLVVLVVDSGVKAHKGGAAQQGYNARVRECAAAAAQLGAPPGGVLAEVPLAQRRPEDLDDPVLRRRASFVFAEAARRDAAVDALRAKDLEALGRLLDESHRGLRDLYEVSDPAVDRIVDELRAAGALGARIVGAGFGGCALAIARRSQVTALTAQLDGRAVVCVASGPAGRESLE